MLLAWISPLALAVDPCVPEVSRSAAQGAEVVTMERAAEPSAPRAARHDSGVVPVHGSASLVSTARRVQEGGRAVATVQLHQRRAPGSLRSQWLVSTIPAVCVPTTQIAAVTARPPGRGSPRPSPTRTRPPRSRRSPGGRPGPSRGRSGTSSRSPGRWYRSAAGPRATGGRTPCPPPRSGRHTPRRLGRGGDGREPRDQRGRPGTPTSTSRSVR